MSRLSGINSYAPCGMHTHILIIINLEVAPAAAAARVIPPNLTYLGSRRQNGCRGMGLLENGLGLPLTPRIGADPLSFHRVVWQAQQPILYRDKPYPSEGTDA